MSDAEIRERLETAAEVATRGARHDPAAAERSIAQMLTGPLSDQGRMHHAALLADLIRRHGGTIAGTDQMRTAALHLNSMAAHGLLVVEAGQ